MHRTAFQRHTFRLQQGAWLETTSTKGLKVYRIIWMLSDSMSRSEALTKDEFRLLIHTLNLKRVDQADGTTRFVVRPGKPMTPDSRFQREASREARLKHYATMLENGAWLETTLNQWEAQRATLAHRIVWTQDDKLHTESLTRTEFRFLLQNLPLQREEQTDGTTRFVLR